MAPHALRTASEWLRLHRPGPTSMKIIGAFAGGVACTGVAIAAWTVPWSEGPRASTASVAQAAVVAPQPTKAANPIVPPAVPITQAAATPGSSQVPCERQTWPYISQQCRHGGQAAKSDAPEGSRRIRVVSADGSAPDSITTGPAAPQPTASKAAVPHVIAPQIAAAEPPQETAPAAAPVPAAAVIASVQSAEPATPSFTTPTAVAIPAVDTQGSKPATRPQDSKQAVKQEKQEAKQENHDKLNAVEPNRAVSDSSSHRSHKPRVRSADLRPAPQQRGRNVVVTQTYQLADGRRVTVTRTYLRGAAQTAEARGAPVALREPEAAFDRDQPVRYRTSAREALFED